MPVPQWSEKYNCHALRLAKGTIVVRANWTSDGFCVSVNEHRLKGRFATIDEAKQAGLDIARKILQHATHELDLLRMAAR